MELSNDLESLEQTMQRVLSNLATVVQAEVLDKAMMDAMEIELIHLNVDVKPKSSPLHQSKADVTHRS